MNAFLLRQLALVVAAALAASPASAAVTVIGGGLGKACFDAATFKRDTRSSIEVCNRALLEEAMSRRDRAATHVNRGIIHMQARDLDRAIADYDMALTIMPQLAEAHVNRGIAFLHRGGMDREAVAALTRGLQLNPMRPEVAYYSRAVANELLGNVRAAYEDYQAAAAARPGWEEPLEQLKRFTVERRPVERG
ncbi:MAG: tetratricopeptide repeat protein [Thermaurantiacus sp.]